MTESAKTHPCALSSEGVATEHYCRVRNREMSAHLKGCAKEGCPSPWRFCPVCIVVRASPIHTLREGGVCKEHGVVGILKEKEILYLSKVVQQRHREHSLPVPEEKRPERKSVVVKAKTSVVEKAPRKMNSRTTPQSLSNRLERVVRLRIREKKRRLHFLGKRLARFRIASNRVVLKAFTLWTYHVAVLENVVRSMPQGRNSPFPTLRGVTKYASRYLDVGHEGFHSRVKAQLMAKDLEELGIRVSVKSVKQGDTLVRQVPNYDFTRFDSEFDEACRLALMRMSSYRPRDMMEVLRAFGEIPRTQWAYWDLHVDPLDVAYTIQIMCADGTMSKGRAGVLFGRPEYWVEIVLKLHKLIPTIRGLIGPKASPHWRLQFGQAVLVSSHKPSQQLSCARDEIWRVVRSRYKT